MNSNNGLLIDQLASINQILASFAHVIIHASERLTRGSASHDFSHSEAVHQRLSELLPDARISVCNTLDLFILIAASYLHDIGQSDLTNGMNHGQASANMIGKDKEFLYLFPSADIRNQIARICSLHDRDIRELQALESDLKLDLRSCTYITRSDMKIHPRFLGAIFRLADELECNSDRMIGQSRLRDDPRIHIAAVRLNLESRSISLDFMCGSSNKDRRKCVDYLKRVVTELGQFLNPYGLSFTIIDKLKESGPSYSEEDEEGEERRLLSIEFIDGVGKPILQPPDSPGSFKKFIDNCWRQRAKRIETISTILSQRSKLK